MSFDQDPGEQAQVSAADFDMMCDEMKELRRQRNVLLAALRKAVPSADGRHASAAGRRHEPVILLQPVQAVPARRGAQATPGREAAAVPGVY